MTRPPAAPACPVASVEGRLCLTHSPSEPGIFGDPPACPARASMGSPAPPEVQAPSNALPALLRAPGPWPPPPAPSAWCLVDCALPTLGSSRGLAPPPQLPRLCRQQPPPAGPPHLAFQCHLPATRLWKVQLPRSQLGLSVWPRASPDSRYSPTRVQPRGWIRTLVLAGGREARARSQGLGSQGPPSSAGKRWQEGCIFP